MRSSTSRRTTVVAAERLRTSASTSVRLRNANGNASRPWPILKALRRASRDPALRRSTPAMWNRVSARTTVAPSVSSRRSAVPRPLTGLTPGRTTVRRAGGRGGRGRGAPLPATPAVRAHPSRRIQVARHEFRHVPRGARQRQSVFPGQRIESPSTRSRCGLPVHSSNRSRHAFVAFSKTNQT